MPVAKFLYSGDNFSSVTVYTTTGSVGTVFLDNQSIFVKKDLVSFYFTRDLTPDEEPIDTVRSEFFFKDSILQRATFTTISPQETRSYSGLIYEYDNNGNVRELGYTNTDGQYIKHMTVTGVDNKRNPVLYHSSLAFCFFFVDFNAELHMGVNNITAVQYGNNDVAEFEYTYTDQGLPLTIKDKAQDFIKFEFGYRK